MAHPTTSPVVYDEDSLKKKLERLMNNPYISFVICSIIKLIFYVILYKIYKFIKGKLYK